jgi:hypothetical protein
MSSAHVIALSRRVARPRTLLWLPFAAIVLVLAVSFLTGRGVTPDAHAADVTVTGSVDAEVFLDTTACTAPSLAIGDLIAGTDGWKTAQDTSGGQVCTLAFGSSNNAAGADLTIFEDPAAPATPTAAMKCVAGSCAGSDISDYDASSEPAAGTSAFGLQLVGSGGAASPTWSSAPAVHDVQDLGDTACRTASIGTGTCSFTPGATAAASDPSGAYSAAAQALVLAR